MGLKLRYNLFYDVQAADVYSVYQEFYGKQKRIVLFEGHAEDAISIYCSKHKWVVVWLGSGWEWQERRKVQRLVSDRLGCPGFLAFVYDGIYWGYEFFVNGIVLDQFVQDPDESENWFPGKPCKGKPDVLITHLPHLDHNLITAYLMQKPAPNKKVRPEDEFSRFDDCAILDFLRYLDVPVSLQEHFVIVESKIFKSFWLGEYAS